MQLENTKIIDRYLSGELSASDHAAFEERLKTSEQLQKEVEIHQFIKQAAIRASVRADVQHAARRYKLNRIIKWGASGLGIIAVIITTSLWISSATKENPEPEQAPTIALSMMKQLTPNADFDRLPIQYFSVPKEGDVFLSDQSVLLSIPRKAFLLNGQTYVGEAIVQFQEAMKANEIVKAGLNTMTGNDLLETQGMFSIHAYTPDGKKLEINPKVGVYVQVPVNEHKAGMQLYDYVELSDGTADWQNPRGLSKIPVPIDMKNLDFYPEGYEAKLDQLKWKRQKSKRDSLYLSFEDFCADISDEKVTKIKPTATTSNQQTTVIAAPIRPIITQGMVVRFPDFEAQFPGGSTMMRKYIMDAADYPEIAIAKGLSGTVYVSMEVDEFGFISKELIERSIDPSLDAEALRIVRNMPSWIPAQNNGQSVRSRIIIPISFYLDDAKQKDQGANMMKGMKGTRNRKAKNTTSPAEVGIEVPLKSNEAETEVVSIPQENPVNATESDSTAADTPCSFAHITPSNVLAFWKPEFNNTNLATREFERRMKAIHATCNDAVLKKYTSQLTRPISEIDRDVVNMGYSDFGSFAKEQVGAVNPNNPHLKNIEAFYEKGVSALKDQAKRDKNWEQQLRNKWDKHLADLQAKHSISTKQRQEKSERDEITYNQQRAVQKLGLNNQSRLKPVAVYPQFGRTIGFTARRSGGYNCDRRLRSVITYQASLQAIQDQIAVKTNQNNTLSQQRKIERVKVAQDVKNGTELRETFSVTANGKTRMIVYNSLSFGVKNPEKYDRIIAYAFPHQLESYQLLKGENGNFMTSLNDDIIYDICVVGISDEGYAYFQKQTLKGGNLGTIDLQKISETKLDASLLQMNSKRMANPASMSLDLGWIKAQKKNFKEINRRKDMAKFREKMVTVIYPCYDSPKQNGDVAEEENPWGI